MPSTPPRDAQRLRREKRTLRAALDSLGFTDTPIGVTGHRAGHAVAWASLPIDAAAPHHDTLTEAGFTVWVGAHTLSITTGDPA